MKKKIENLRWKPMWVSYLQRSQTLGGAWQYGDWLSGNVQPETRTDR